MLAQGVDRLCPKCERVPEGPGALCPTCGARLVELAPEADLVGTVIDGRFEIRGFLGEGGMGTVYRAYQRSVGREVAVKVIDRKKVRDAMAVRRFLREAKLASQLAHPNTVHVIDFGQAEDRQLFIAMELVRGRTLADVVAQDGGLGLVRAVGVGMQLCDALEAAHGLSIVHRDLKPANVILVEDPNGRDRIKVLDFGLAKSLVADDSESTQTGDIVGTPRYLAPELAMGEEATARSDLYAVGVMLVELSTGRRLFDGARMVDMMRQKATDPRVPAEVPPALAAIVAQLIDPEPLRRPASAAALRAMLHACIEGAAGATAPAAAARAGAPASAPAEATRATGPVRFTATSAPPEMAVAAVAVIAPRSRRRTAGWLAAAIVALGVVAPVAILVRSSSSEQAANAREERPVVAPDPRAPTTLAVAIDAAPAAAVVAIDAPVAAVAIDPAPVAPTAIPAAIPAAPVAPSRKTDHGTARDRRREPASHRAPAPPPPSTSASGAAAPAPPASIHPSPPPAPPAKPAAGEDLPF
jgi:serine/threonine-protein kinase